MGASLSTALDREPGAGLTKKDLERLKKRSAPIAFIDPVAVCGVAEPHPAFHGVSSQDYLEHGKA